MIELRHLRYFVAVAEELHFGRAAQRLHIAQPALSRQVQRLEEEVGTLLIKRSQRSVVLTAAGAAYLEHARHVLDEVMRAGTEAVRIANGEIGALRVTFIHSSTYNLTPTILGIFTKRHPQISLNLREMTVIGQVEALARGDVDVALLRPPIKNKVLEWETVMQESFVVAVPESHLLAAEETVSIQALRDEPFIMFTSHQSPLFHSRILSLCDAAGFIPRVAQEAIQIHTVLGLVGAGLGIALVPEAALHLFMPRVRFIELEEHMEPVDVALAWRRDNPNPAVPLFRAAVLEAARLILSQRASTRASGFTNRLPRE